MAYERFKLSARLATLATAATLHEVSAQSVANVATVAGLAEKNEVFRAPTVANVATVASPSQRELDPETAGRANVARLISAVSPAVMAAARVHDENRRRALATVKRQVNIMACYVCDYPETEGRMFIPVLSDAPGVHYWMHKDCWPEHVARCERVEDDEDMA